MPTLSLGAADHAVIGGYFAALGAIAVWSIVGRSEAARAQPSGYFLSARSESWPVIGLALFASNISAEHFVGLAATGAAQGINASWGEWGSVFAILVLAYGMLPFYLRAGVVTLPEFLALRYSPRCQMILAGVSLLLYVISKISVSLYAGAVLLRAWFGLSLELSAAAVGLLSTAYTVAGGLKTVLWTETLQAFVLFGGGVAMLAVGLAEVGGWSQLVDRLQDLDDEHLLHAYAPPDSEKGFPITGVALGLPFVSLWFWCTDQAIVQRALAARTLGDGVAGCLLAALLKIAVPFIMILPGVFARALFPDDIDADANDAFALMVDILPTGVKGVMVSAVLAALMSSLASTLNSAATILSVDVWRRWNPAASQARLVAVGKVGGAAMFVLGFLWLPLIDTLSDSLYVYTHKAMSFIAPPISVVFFAGIASQRVNATGAAAALVVGITLGMVRLVVEIAAPASSLARVHFLHFCAASGALCIAVIHGVSAYGTPPGRQQLDGLTWSARMRTPAAREPEEATAPILADGLFEQPPSIAPPLLVDADKPPGPTVRVLSLIVAGATMGLFALFW